jgi:hypothetical protein
MNCNLMLQSAFDWAKKKQSDSGLPQVFATVTIHHSLDRFEKTSDVVYYANGPLALKSPTPGQEILTNSIQCWTNKTQEITIPDPPPKPGENENIGEIIKDLFPTSNPHNRNLLLIVSQTGLITVGKLIGDKLIGGIPASTFQATCQDELLTGIVDILGEAVCTVSFSLGFVFTPK